MPADKEIELLLENGNVKLDIELYYGEDSIVTLYEEFLRGCNLTIEKSRWNYSEK